MLSKIVQESVESWRDFFGEKSQHCEQKYLTADTNGIIKEFLISSQISLLQTELERKKYRLGQLESLFKKFNLEVDEHRMDEVNTDITYLTEQIEECKKLLK